MATSRARSASILDQHVDRKYLIYALIMVVAIIVLSYYALSRSPHGNATTTTSQNTVLHGGTGNNLTNFNTSISTTITQTNGPTTIPGSSTITQTNQTGQPGANSTANTPNNYNNYTTSIFPNSTIGIVVSSNAWRSNFSANYIYCVGTQNTINRNESYYAQISSTGIGSWIKAQGYPNQLYGGSCSIYNGQLLCFGTPGPSIAEHQSYYSQLSVNWTNATWRADANYPINLTDAGCSIYQGFVYCVGTEYPGESNQVYFAPLQFNPYIQSTGVVQWNRTTNYPINFAYGSCSVYGGFIYCIGALPIDGNFIVKTPAYFAPVSANGIGAWKETTSYPTTFYQNTCAINSGYIYCVGSFNVTALGSGHSPAYFAPVSANGIGAWQQTTGYPDILFNAGCSISNTTHDIYCVGSQLGTSQQEHAAYFATISSNGIGAWKQTTSYPVTLYGMSCEIPGSGGGYLTGGGQQ